MNRFFIDEKIQAGMLIQDPETIHHVKKVLRLSPGQMIEGIHQERVFLLEILEITDRILLKPVEELPAPPVSSLRITLFQGLPKGDKMEWILQKATELGVSRVVPVNTQYSLMKIKKMQKLSRWEKILAGATLQSKGVRIPLLEAPVDVEEVVARYIADLDRLLVLYEGETPGGLGGVLAGLKEAGHIGIFIGPEGGLSSGDLKWLEHQKMTRVSLGPRILRTETAAMAMTAIVQYALGDVGE